MSEQELILRIGFFFLAMGVLTGVKAFLLYDGSLFSKDDYQYNALELYAKKVMLKHKNGLALIHIAIGILIILRSITYTPAITYTSSYTESSTTVYLSGKVWLAVPFIVIWFLSEYMAFAKAWFVIRKRKLVEYYSIVNNSTDQKEIEKNWCNLHYIISKGEEIIYKDLNKEKLKMKSELLIARYKLK